MKTNRLLNTNSMKWKQRSGGFKSPTLLKTCENTREIRECRRPQDWALLALQNIRSGKSQYLVICHCLRGELGKSIDSFVKDITRLTHRFDMFQTIGPTRAKNVKPKVSNG